MASLHQEWQAAFWRTVQQQRYAEPLREAARQARLAAWTVALTDTAVAACDRLGWQASARRHILDLFPVPASEYLVLDLMGFAGGEKPWRFPKAVMEFENGKDHRIAYSLWKVLCVRCDLRVVFCYRRKPEEGAALLRSLREQVIDAIDVRSRERLQGETLVVVGSRDESQTFPYEFFKWWRLERNTGIFRPM